MWQQFQADLDQAHVFVIPRDLEEITDGKEAPVEPEIEVIFQEGDHGVEVVHSAEDVKLGLTGAGQGYRECVLDHDVVIGTGEGELRVDEAKQCLEVLAGDVGFDRFDSEGSDFDGAAEDVTRPSALEPLAAGPVLPVHAAKVPRDAIQESFFVANHDVGARVGPVVMVFVELDIES